NLGGGERGVWKWVEIGRRVDVRESIAMRGRVVARGGVDGRVGGGAGQTLYAVTGIVEEIGSKYVGQSILEVSVGLAVLRREWQRATRFYGAAEAVAL